MKSLLGAAELADEVRAKEFPAQAPEELCRLLQRVARKATERIPKLSADKPQEAVSQADLLCLLAREIAEHVRYPERAVTLETPWSIVETVEEFGKKVYGSEVSFIVRPKWSYNYSLVGEFRGYYLDKLQALFPGSAPSDLVGTGAPVYVISFPRLEKSNTLLHACFAHELGHFVSTKWLGDELPKSGLLDQLRARLLTYIKHDTQDPVAVALKLANLERQAQSVLRRGLEELLADLAAVQLFGPCVLFAMSHMARQAALAEIPSEGNEHYPPWGYRLHEVFRIAGSDLFFEAGTILENRGFHGARKHVQDFMDELREFIGTKDASLDMGTWPVATRCAYEVVEAALPGLEKWIGQQIAALAYCGQPERLAHFCIDIEAGIPPLLTEGDRELPSDFRDILNAGWLYLITRVNETMQSLANDAAAYRKQRRKLDLLVLKAIESSYLLQHYIPKLPGPAA
jgi:hypothetical protein